MNLLKFLCRETIHTILFAGALLLLFGYLLGIVWIGHKAGMIHPILEPLVDMVLFFGPWIWISTEKVK